MKQITQEIQLNKDTNVMDIWDTKQLDPMGSGSDHASFFMEAAVSSIMFGMDSKDGKYNSVYHSNYDSIYWMNHFGDPNLSAHITMAKVFGMTMMRLADDVILPFTFEDYASTLNNFVSNLQNLTEKVNFVPMSAAVEKFTQDVSVVRNEINTVDTNSFGKLRSLNDRLMLTERVFLGNSRESGSERWKHVIYTPAKNDEYGDAPFPAIRNAIENGDFDEANFLVMRMAQIISAAGDYLKGDLWQ
eukprot:TRINITY_DN2426_c1_g1_i1.p1 TRINITY_DN2426_c1_g1~~TRINITY_DN2426_c1_g1_i1.p1  ORF type:complete len:257 (+),score=56.25 TRINITY_DN2426_c1_g1_i1:37-771(+)